jgi:predicted enzyme related to lactoylglutathione lyase
LWARDAERQAAFYGELFNWEVGAGLIMQMPAGLGGLEPGLGGHIRRGDSPAVILDVQVRDLRASLARAQQFGSVLVTEPFDIPDGPTLAAVEGNRWSSSSSRPSTVRKADWKTAQAAYRRSCRTGAADDPHPATRQR